MWIETSYTFYDISLGYASFKKYLLDIYRNGIYHSLKKYAKKFPLPMSGEGG
jgi:hypothetical protein